MTAADRTVDVAIVGGGPVGIGLAIELGQRGVDCVLVERFREPQPIPKGQNLTQRTMEHFHFWGAEPALRAARTIPVEYGIGGLTAYGTLLGPYHHDWLQRELVRPYYFKSNERLPQYATEAVLRRRLSELPSVQTRYGWQAVDVAGVGDGGDAQRESRVRIEVAARDGGDRATLHARWVVGCDGSRSLVRERAGIAQSLSDHDRLMVLLVFRSHRLHELLARYPGKSYYNVLQPELEGYWKFFGRVDLGSTWFFHAPVPAGTTRDNFDFVRLLHEAVDAEFDVELRHVGFWDLRFAVAERYRAGRAFVAGDAAHSHPPYGGYGINTGFEDAKNLGWKLAAVLRGWGGAHLLDSYDGERRPVFASTARDFIARAIESDRAFLRAHDPAKDRADFERAWAARGEGAVGEVHAFEPNYEGSPIVVGDAAARGRGPSAVGRHAFTARAGHHLAPALLDDGIDVYELLASDGFTLLAFDAEERTLREFVAAASARAVPLAVVERPRSAEAERYGARLVLVRPDQFVAWAGHGDEHLDAAAILDAARGAR